MKKTTGQRAYEAYMEKIGLRCGDRYTVSWVTLSPDQHEDWERCEPGGPTPMEKKLCR